MDYPKRRVCLLESCCCFNGPQRKERHDKVFGNTVVQLTVAIVCVSCDHLLNGLYIMQKKDVE